MTAAMTATRRLSTHCSRGRLLTAVPCDEAITPPTYYLQDQPVVIGITGTNVPPYGTPTALPAWLVPPASTARTTNPPGRRSSQDGCAGTARRDGKRHP